MAKTIGLIVNHQNNMLSTFIHKKKLRCIQLNISDTCISLESYEIDVKYFFLHGTFQIDVE